MSERAYVIRRMQPSDVAGAMALIGPQHWNQTGNDWRRFMALEPRGCFVAVSDAQVVATTTTERFGPVGWIGMVIVQTELRGAGIGRAMMAQAISYLHRAGARTIKLDATPAGKPLYDKLGFQAEYRLERYRRVGEALDAPGVSPCDGRSRMWQEALALDRSAYHTDRSAMLARLAEGWPELSAVHLGPGGVDGYLVGRHGTHFEHLGPLVAATREGAEALLRWGLSRAGERPAIIDRPDPNAAARDLMTTYGFEPMREFTRMHLGQEPYRDDPGLIFGSSGAEKG